MSSIQRFQQDHGARWQDLLLVAAGAFALMWPAILNGFPLIFHDTNSYVRLIHELPRSYFYKIFVFATGLKLSLWPTMIAQCVISSASVFCFIKLFNFQKKIFFVLAMVIIAIGSSLPIYANFIMPDFFTGLMILAVFSAVFMFDRMSVAWRVLIFLMLLLSISSHLSHLVLAVALTVTGGVLLIIFTPQASRKGILLALVASATVAAAFMLYHGVKYRHYAISPAGTTFLMASLIESGSVRKELNETCPQAGYRLCAYRNGLSTHADDFLWTKDGPFNRNLGGFEGMRTEAQTLLWQTITHHPQEILLTSARNSARALISANPAKDVVRMDPSVSILQRIIGRVYGPLAVRQFDVSAQESNQFPVAAVATLNYAVLTGSILAILLVAVSNAHIIDKKIWAFTIFVLMAYVGNAALCGTVSGVHDRYQARVSWLIPLAAVLLLFDWWNARRMPSPFAEPGR